MNPPPARVIDVEWHDISYTCRFTPDERGYSADFAIFSMVILAPEVTYPKKDYVALPQDSTPNLDEAQPCVSGWVKWDGCTEFDTSEGPQRNCVHVCGPSSMAHFTAALTRIYDLAREHIPHWLEQ